MPSKQVPRESKVPQVSRAIKTRGTRDTRSPLDTSSKNPQTMEELLAQTGYQVHGLKRDQQIEGTVTNVTSRTIFFDVGAKAEGIVVDREFEAAKDYIKALKIGDKVSLRVLYPENETGQVVLSLKGEALSSAWKHLLKAKDAGEEISVVVKETVKGGFLVNSFGVVGFLPTSQLGEALQKKQSDLEGKNLKVKVIEVDKTQNRVVFSEKAVSEKEKLEKIKGLIAKVKEGEIYEAEITGTMPFGAFAKIKVDNHDVEGLIHVSEMSWEKIDNPEGFYRIGDKVKIKVISKDESQSRLSFSIRQLTEDPWKNLIGKYQVDLHVVGKVSRLVASGAFLELEPGLEGFIHISKIPVEKQIKVGDSLDCFVEAIEPEKRRISLGLVLTEKPVGYK